MIEYYDKLDFRFPEMCVSKVKFNENNPGLVKFYIPVLMPFIKEDDPKETKVRPTITHLVNKEKDDIKPSDDCKISNYVEIELPKWVAATVRNSNNRDPIEDNIDDDISDDKKDDPIVPPTTDLDIDPEVQMLIDIDPDTGLGEIKPEDDVDLEDGEVVDPDDKEDGPELSDPDEPDDTNDLDGGITDEMGDDQTFIIVFIGGDINNKRIIGRY